MCIRDRFKSLTIEDMINALKAEYIFVNNNDELVIQQYIHNENLENTYIANSNRVINCSKGEIYIAENPQNNNAIIQLDDGVIINILSNLPDDNIIELVEMLT